MNRRHLAFECDGSELVGTLNEAAGETGLLIVTGGNETRAGAWSGQALLAVRVAAAGFPVFRFDRRGVGDSAGGNAGFRSSGPDIAAAVEAFCAAAPVLKRVVAMGNCDAASALMLTGGAGCNGLVLSNPWTFEDDDAASSAPPAALRAHYRQRLASPAALKRLFTGQVSLGKLFASLVGAARPAPPPSTLAQDMAAGLATFPGPVRILLAERDRTAQAFLATWDSADERVRRCSDASHSYVEPEAFDWLEGQVLEALKTA